MTTRCDVCIVTDLCFPGGNASSTLDEIDTFTRAGLRVRAVHCPANVSRGKPVSERYQRVASLCLTDAPADAVHADVMLIRNPSVVTGGAFPAIAERLHARVAAFIVNNSFWRPTGQPAYDLGPFIERVRGFDAELRAIFPIGPVIRAELAMLLPAQVKRSVGPFDWTPTFDLHELQLRPRARLQAPFRIGRHGRDAVEKWLQDPALLREAYPGGGDFRVQILGGADRAVNLLGTVPDHWSVLPFGAMPVPQFLDDLDALVYFPHTELKEAFGRTVVEAVMAGVPCVLSTQLRTAFAELAFFCEPRQVADVVRRLAEQDDMRLEFLQHAHDVAAAAFSSASLFTRLERLDAAAASGKFPHAEARAAATPELRRYMRWVETGREDLREGGQASA